MNTIIKLNHITKTFGKNTVLKDINLTVAKGEIFGLLGPSGSGKTTMIKIMTGQLEATSGEASVFGTSCKKLTSAEYDRTGMVLDECGLYGRLSCYDNLKLFADIYGIDKQSIHSSLKSVYLEDAARTPVNRLSKGMKQRLVFARALLHSPELLFLDEPTSGLDPATASEIHKLINQLSQSGITIFMTTHNMNEASELCDNIAMLNHGMIVEYGTPEEICSRYNNDCSFKITLISGQELVLPYNESSVPILSRLIVNKEIKTLHSTEPDLEDVFMLLTDRKLV